MPNFMLLTFGAVDKPKLSQIASTSYKVYKFVVTTLFRVIVRRK